MALDVSTCGPCNIILRLAWAKNWNHRIKIKSNLFVSAVFSILCLFVCVCVCICFMGVGRTKREQ